MIGGTPLILWRYVLSAMWRLVLLSTGVLVSVLAFAMSVKLLADGKLGPGDTLKFMGYAIPPMLEYALPFGAGFGATLAYHRLAADNEVVASQAGGVSYRSLLAPGLLTGVALMAVLLALSNQVIPTLLRSMQELAVQDITRLMVASIKRGEAVDLGAQGHGRVYLTADLVEAKGADPAAHAYQVLWLKNVVLVQFNADHSRVEQETMMDSAWVWFSRGQQADGPAGAAGGEPGSATTLVTVKPQGAVVRDRKGTQAEVKEGSMVYALPTPLRDDPKFLSWGELRDVRRRPEMIGPIDSSRRTLATLLAERGTVDQLQKTVRAEGRISLLAGGGERVVVRASSADWDEARKLYRLLDAGGVDAMVRVDRTMADGSEQRHAARRAWLRSMPRASDAGREITFSLVMEEVATTGASSEPTAERRSGVAGVRQSLELDGLTLVGSATPDFMGRSSAELLELADQRVAAYPWEAQRGDGVGPARDELRKRIKGLLREVVSKEQERIAMAVACLVMVVTGCVMAMRLRESLPLVVYLWSFAPALGAVLTIVGGQQVVHSHGPIGLLVLWGGVGGLGVFAVAEYIKLRQH